MTARDPGALIEALIGSLHRESEMLVSGDYERLAEEATVAAKALARLEALPREALDGHGENLKRMREACMRNERLLRAAVDGAAAGKRRLAEILDARVRLSSYDASGNPVERRAAATAGRKV